MHSQRIAVRTLCLWLSSLTVVAGALTACVVAPPPPYEDYAIARAAVKAAQEVDSARFATSTWHKAEEYYRNGQKAYRENDFAQAKRYFKLAVQFAENAENATRLKKFKSGDNFP